MMTVQKSENYIHGPILIKKSGCTILQTQIIQQGKRVVNLYNNY